jgi:AcrR family transcriptional regulator
MADKRVYSSELRDQQARRTRKQIVDAAAELFVELGFAGTTVDAVAAKAGVSRKTVFTAVGGKVQLLKLAYDFTTSGDDEPVPMIRRESLGRVMAEPDPYRQIQLFAEHITELMGRVSQLWVVLRSAADVDPEARELYDRWEEERRQAMINGPIADLARKKVLRPDLRKVEAAEILWLLTDPSVYHRFVIGRGWPPKRFTRWFADAVESMVMVPR